MIKLRQAVVVEGRYDKNVLSQLIDAPIFETRGFGVMKDRQLLAFLREVAQRRGLIILTDSDGAGFVIRNYLKGALPKQGVFHAYIPDVFGKEPRKAQPGKEGKLGVEGMQAQTLLTALENAGAQLCDTPSERITKADLYFAGLSGGENSAQRRRALMRQLKLPEHLGSGAFLEALNILFPREVFLEKYGVKND